MTTDRMIIYAKFEKVKKLLENSLKPKIMKVDLFMFSNEMFGITKLKRSDLKY